MIDTNAMEDQETLKIVLIEDDETIRSAYTFLLGHSSGLEVIGAFASAEEALKKLPEIQPHIILLDVELPGINGIEAIPKLKRIVPAAQILILTVYEDEAKIFEALAQGATGYLTKNTPSAKIVEAIREVSDGGAPMSIGVARIVIESFRKNPITPLTKRETQILEEIANGKGRGRIADEMFIDTETVKSHIKNIYIKLNVHTKSEAIKTAREKKWI